MHGRRALSEQDCWSDIGGVVLRERRSHDKGGMDGPSGRGDLLSSLFRHCQAIQETTGVTVGGYTGVSDGGTVCFSTKFHNPLHEITTWFRPSKRRHEHLDLLGVPAL